MVAISRSLYLLAAANPGYCFRMQTGSNEHLGAQTPTRESLTACPCTIWQHCSRIDIRPGDDQDQHGVACVASENAIVTLGHQVQCVPQRHGGLDYHCPSMLSHMCDPSKECLEADLGTCDNFDGCTGDYTRKWNSAQFCATSECTHAECCNPLGWYFEMTVLRPMPTQSPATMTCPEQRGQVTEPTMERLTTYINACGFNPGDVDYSGTQLQLTEGGRAKLASESCQNQQFLTCGLDDIAGQASRVASGSCGNPVWDAQLSPTGVFGTASALDAIWRAARDAADRPPDACGVQTEAPGSLMPDPTMPPSFPEEDMFAAAGVPAEEGCAAPICPDGRCCPCGRLNLRLGSSGESSIHVPWGNDLEEVSIPCDIGPYQYGTVDVKCTWQGWLVESQSCSRYWLVR